MDMNISYDAYRVFYQVARCRSFTRAAQELCSNQPNVSRTIKNLEHGLGCSLFVRSNRAFPSQPKAKSSTPISVRPWSILRRKPLQMGKFTF